MNRAWKESLGVHIYSQGEERLARITARGAGADRGFRVECFFENTTSDFRALAKAKSWAQWRAREFDLRKERIARNQGDG